MQRSTIIFTIALCLAGLLPIQSAFSLIQSIPYTSKDFSREFAVDPLFATRRAIETRNLHFVYQLNFSEIDPSIADRILDASISDEFPATKIAEAISSGTILKITTWKRLSQTQLEASLLGGGTVRDASPDLSQLPSKARDASIADNAGLSGVDHIETSPSPGATSLTEQGKVTISGLESLVLSSPHLLLQGIGLEQTRIQGHTLEIGKLHDLIIQIPSPRFRESILPDRGASPTRQRLLIIHNATMFRMEENGTVWVENADEIKLFIPENTSYPGQSFKQPDQSVKQNSQPVSTVFHGTNIRIFIKNGSISLDPFQGSFPSMIDVGSAHHGSFFGIEQEGISNIHADLENHVLQVGSATHIHAEPLEIDKIQQGIISLSEKGFRLSIEKDAALSIRAGNNQIHYQATQPGNQLQADPAQPRILTMRGAALTFSQNEMAELVQAGNSTVVYLDTQGGFNCANFEPVSSFTLQPGFIEKSISIVAFSKSHMVCVTKDPSIPGNQLFKTCTTDCTLIDLDKKIIIHNGQADFQLPREKHPRSFFSSYSTNTAALHFDPVMSTVTLLELLDNKPAGYSPTNAVRITEQAGHRMAAIAKGLEPVDVSNSFISTVQSNNLPAIQFTKTYAYQNTTQGTGVYILYPNNPQINDLIRLADKRMEN